MISAQRMKFLDEETNVGIVSILDIDTPDIYNTVTNELNEVTKGLQGIMDSAKQSLASPLKKAKDLEKAALDIVRSARDAFTSLQSLTGMTEAKVLGKIKDMLPDNPQIQNAFSNLSKECRNKALGKKSGFKPFKDNMKCGGKSSKMGGGNCQTSEVKGVLGKLGVGINAIVDSLNDMLQKIISLASMGFDAGLCKIFAALTQGMPGNIVQRGAATLLAMTGSAGNTTGYLDVAANMGNSLPSLEIPGLVGMGLDNFKIPSGWSSQDLPSLATGYFDALDSVKQGWNVSSLDNLPSLKEVSTFGSDMGRTLQAAASDSVFDFTDINTAELNTIAPFAGAWSSSSIASDLDSFW